MERENDGLYGITFEHSLIQNSIIRNSLIQNSHSIILSSNIFTWIFV
jgi:hypothetical protein